LFEAGGDNELENKRELENERESAATANVTSVVALTVRAETGSTCEPNCSLEWKYSEWLKRVQGVRSGGTDELGVRIKKVQSNGRVTLRFDADMLIADELYDLIENSTITQKHNVTYPAFDVQVLPGESTPQEHVSFNWTIVSFSKNELVLQLNFTYPEFISMHADVETL